MNSDELRNIIRGEVSAKFNEFLKQLKPDEIEVLNEKQAYTMLRINPRTLKKLSVEGLIPCLPLGNGQFRYSKKVLAENFEQIQKLKYSKHD